MKIKQVHYDNLMALKNYIRDNVSPDHFDMADFRASSPTVAVKFKSLHDCGTVGCALGWLPFALNMTDKELEPFLEYLLYLDETVLNFHKLSRELLGLGTAEEENEETWLYLFSGVHALRNYTPAGFSAGFNAGFSADMTTRYSGEEQKAAFIERADIVLTEWKNIIGEEA